KYGVGIVTLGGFTSVVIDKLGCNLLEEIDVPVTTGNTFTSAMVIEGILKACQILNLDISSLKIAIVGATGDIGSACSRVFVDKAKEVILTSRTKEKLKLLAKELNQKKKAKVSITTDNREAVKDADVVLACARASHSIISLDWFKSGSIICDVGYPKNVPYTSSREDIFIFSGGLVKSPTAIDFPMDLGLPTSEVLYGCFAEAIILALERRYESFSSLTRGKITPEKIEEIRSLGKKHGFEVAEFYWNNKLIDNSQIEKIKELIKVSL
ncbi:MAG: NAD(P)-binding domain-containing protein, partial [Candidatus Omnitrophica bacterium]|nr:NAD(P)-binding domain-containing protein [Candidatus Omnitrophota bacterium]